MTGASAAPEQVEQGRVGLVGLGLMGSVLSERLIERGWQVLGFDTDDQRLSDHAQRGGTAAGGIREVGERVPEVVLSLPHSGVVREVCLGPEGLADAAGLELVIDTTTSRPSDCVDVATALEDRGVAFVDACLSGSSQMAREGDVVAMVGGSEQAAGRAREVLQAFARSVHHLGPVGSGSKAKLIVNLVLGLHRFALAEGLVLGEKGGVDLSALLEVLRDSAAYSRAMDVWGARMVAGDHEPPASRIRQHTKDVGLIMEQGGEVGAPLLLGAVEWQLLRSGVASGLGDLDNSGVVEVVRRLAGIGRIE